MDKNEVLKILETAKDKNGEVPMRLVRQAFEKLPESCEDTISRQAAIDAMTNTLWHYPNECYRNLNEYEFAKGLAELGLKSVPPVQPSFPQRHENDYIAEVSKMECVSRQAVKDALVERTILEWEQLKTCYPMLEAVDEVPPAQPEIEERKEETAQNVPNGELISKEAAIDAIAELQGRASAKGVLIGIHRAWKAIKDLPSVQPEHATCYLDSPCEYQNINIALPPAHPEQRWIPCSERLPEVSDLYIVTSTNKIQPVGTRWFNKRRNDAESFWSGHPYGKVLAWMPIPLPEPYRKEGENDA